MERACGFSSVICVGGENFMQRQRNGRDCRCPAPQIGENTVNVHRLYLNEGSCRRTMGKQCIGTKGPIVFPRKAMLNHSSILGRHYDRWSPRAQSIRLSSAASIKYRGIYRSDKRRLISNATSKPLNTDSYAADSLPINNKGTFETLWDVFNAFYRFSRPHTVIGTVIGIISVSLLAVQSVLDLSPIFFMGLLKALIPALFMNIYIVGLNQISDIAIDKVNKPDLPLASGEFSIGAAVVIVIAFAFMSLGMGLMFGSTPLLWALFTSFVLGTAYSIDLPFLRWKRSALAAASCILCVRAVVVQIAFYLHIQSSVYGRPAILTKPLVFATAFMCFFSVVIALFKILAKVGISFSHKEEILIAAEGLITPTTNDESTYEALCTFDDEQLYKQEIKEDNEELRHDLRSENYAYESNIERWFQEGYTRCGWRQNLWHSIFQCPSGSKAGVLALYIFTAGCIRCCHDYGSCLFIHVEQTCNGVRPCCPSYYSLAQSASHRPQEQSSNYLFLYVYMEAFLCRIFTYSIYEMMEMDSL